MSAPKSVSSKPEVKGGEKKVDEAKKPETTETKKPETNGDKSESKHVYVHSTEESLKKTMQTANEDKKVPFGGYRIELKSPIPVGVHFVMGYSPREAMGQLLNYLGVEAESVEAPARRAATPEEAVASDPTLNDETRAQIAKLLADARAKKS